MVSDWRQDPEHEGEDFEKRKEEVDERLGRRTSEKAT